MFRVWLKLGLPVKLCSVVVSAPPLGPVKLMTMPLFTPILA